MAIFAELRTLIRLERQYLPFVETIEDRNILTEIGYHETEAAPLSLKLLFLLNISSIATIQRRLARLVSLAMIVKRRSNGDKRVSTLHLSDELRDRFRRYESDLNGNGVIGNGWNGRGHQ